MVRLVFSFVVTVVTARWLYSEVQLFIPQAVPVVDYALERVQIPTHDKWDLDGVMTLLEDRSTKAVKPVAANSRATRQQSKDYRSF